MIIKLLNQILFLVTFVALTYSYTTCMNTENTTPSAPFLAEQDTKNSIQRSMQQTHYYANRMIFHFNALSYSTPPETNPYLYESEAEDVEPFHAKDYFNEENSAPLEAQEEEDQSLCCWPFTCCFK